MLEAEHQVGVNTAHTTDIIDVIGPLETNVAFATSKFIMELVSNRALTHCGDSVLVVVCERTREVVELFHDARMAKTGLLEFGPAVQGLN